MATHTTLTLAEAAAQAGQQAEMVPHMTYPNENFGGIHAMRDAQTFFKKLMHQACGVPEVGDPTYAPPVTFFDDFLVGGANLLSNATDNPETDGEGFKFGTVDNFNDWLASSTHAGGESLLVVDDTAPGGWLKVTTAGNQNDQISAQMCGTAFLLADGKPLYCEARLMIEDISETDAYFGLSIPNTDITASVGASDDAVGFHIEAGQISYIASKDGVDATADTTLEFADGSIATAATKSKRLGFYWDGAAELSFYVNGVTVKTLTAAEIAANLNQDEAMSLVFAVDAVGGAAAETLWVDYIVCTQERT